jgi:hypothetical protein
LLLFVFEDIFCSDYPSSKPVAVMNICQQPLTLARYLFADTCLNVAVSIRIGQAASPSATVLMTVMANACIGKGGMKPASYRGAQVS